MFVFSIVYNYSSFYKYNTGTVIIISAVTFIGSYYGCTFYEDAADDDYSLYVLSFYITVTSLLFTFGLRFIGENYTTELKKFTANYGYYYVILFLGLIGYVLPMIASDSGKLIKTILSFIFLTAISLFFAYGFIRFYNEIYYGFVWLVNILWYVDKLAKPGIIMFSLYNIFLVFVLAGLFGLSSRRLMD